MAIFPILFIGWTAVSWAQTDPNGNGSPPLRALVHGPIRSTIYDNLKSNLDTTSDDGTLDATSYELLVYDGKLVESGRDERTLEKQISDALNNGRWVLAFDLTYKQKMKHFGAVINFASKSSSSSYLVRAVTEPDGTRSWRIIASDLQETSSSGAPGALESATINGAGLATTISGYLQNPNASMAPTLPADSSTLLGTPPSPDNPIPSGLIHSSFYFTNDSGAVTGLPQPQKRTDAAKQSYQRVVNYTVTIFLNNLNNASGDFQYVLIQTDASVNPSAGTGYFANRRQDEQAWFLAHAVFTLNPQNSGDFNWVSNDPVNANAVSTYTASSAFNVGFTANCATGTSGCGAGISSSYTWGTSSSFQLQDWGVTSNGSGTSMNWDFRSTNPDADKGLTDCSTSRTWFDVCHAINIDNSQWPNTPNSLSLNQSVYHTSVAYKTSSVLSSWENFNAGGHLEWWDTYCDRDTGLICAYLIDPKYPDLNKTFQTPIGQVLTINMAAVKPVPSQNITFNQDPAVAGNTVTGQIFLNAPAAIDTPIYLYSNNTSASVLPTVTVKAGQSSTQFQVLTSSNNGGSGAINTATITAFNTQGFQEQLLLKNYASGDLLPPSGFPTTSNDAWAQKVPFGRWVSGYQVRYALSYIDTNGKETDRGPWTAWFSNPGYALPHLYNISIASDSRVTGRKIYRQFYSDVQNGNLSAGVELIGTLSDNKTTDFQDESPQ